MHSLASALSSVTNLALGATKHHHSSPLRTRTSTESEHQTAVRHRVMASVDEEQTIAGAANANEVQSNMQSVDGVNRTSRAGSGSLSAMPFSGLHSSIPPATRAERSSAALYTAILNRVDHIQKYVKIKI